MASARLAGGSGWPEVVRSPLTSTIDSAIDVASQASLCISKGSRLDPETIDRLLAEALDDFVVNCMSQSFVLLLYETAAVAAVGARALGASALRQVSSLPGSSAHVVITRSAFTSCPSGVESRSTAMSVTFHVRDRSDSTATMQSEA